MPKLAKVRVIAGTGGFGNPLLPRGSSHDGRVLVSETKLRTPHDHVRVRSTHGFMMYHPRVVRMTKDFIDGTDRGLAAWSSRSREDEDYLSSSASSSRRRTGEDDSEEDEDQGGPGAAVAAVAEAVRVGAGSGEELKVDERDREQAERVRERRRAARRRAMKRDLRMMQAEEPVYDSELGCNAALSRICLTEGISGSEDGQWDLGLPGVSMPMMLEAAEHDWREPCLAPSHALLPGMQDWRADHAPSEAFV